MTPRSRSALQLERLEGRITPTAVYTYADVDGDLVTVRSSKGTTVQVRNAFAGAEMPPVSNLGNQLGNVSLSAVFDGADISITARPQDANQDGTIDGDGFVNVGSISRLGGTLGNILIHGDLGRITVGVAGNTTQLRSLTVQSLGEFGTSTGAPDLVSTVLGNVGMLVVKGDIDHAAFSVGQAGVGRIGSVSVGGSILGGSVSGQGGIGSIKVAGSVLGGSVGSATGIGSIAIGGDLAGGRGNSTGLIDVTAGAAGAGGAIGRITIGGSVRGSDSDGANLTDTGSIRAVHIGSLVVGGSIVSGQVVGGGSLSRSGWVQAADDIGSITVRGSLLGNATYPVLITARGQAAPTATRDMAIGSLRVGGRVEFADIGAGYSQNFRGRNADAQIGSIKVGGDWLASSVVVGLNAGADFRIGTIDDVSLHAGEDFGDGPVADGRPVSKISSIVIGGQVLGQPGSDTTFGFAAQQIGSFRSGGIALPLRAGASNDRFGVVNTLHVGVSLSATNFDGFAVHVFEI